MTLLESHYNSGSQTGGNLTRGVNEAASWGNEAVTKSNNFKDQ